MLFRHLLLKQIHEWHNASWSTLVTKHERVHLTSAHLLHSIKDKLNKNLNLSWSWFLYFILSRFSLLNCFQEVDIFFPWKFLFLACFSKRISLLLSSFFFHYRTEGGDIQASRGSFLRTRKTHYLMVRAFKDISCKKNYSF